MSDDFFPIRLNTLRPDENVTFDVYIKIADRYIHYTHHHDQMEGSRIKKLKSKGLRKFFINAKDEDVYLHYLENGLNILSDSTLDVATRASVANDSMVTAAENAERTLETENGFNSQRNQMDKISDFLLNDQNALKEILSAAGISSDNNQHSATVSSLCLAVAGKAGMSDRTEIFELGLAGLLHDIGKTRLKFSSMKPHSQLSPQELKEFKNHPQDGADMLAGKPFISPRILGLIASHEEKGDGRGFPEKKILSKMGLSYQILSMVNQFDHFCWENKMSATSAIDPFFEKEGKNFSDKLINILATVLT